MKKLFYILLFVPLFFISSCEEDNTEIEGCISLLACNYNSEATIDNNSCEYPEEGFDCDGNITEYLLGMEAEGGIIFYLDESGEHGLVAAMEDLPETYEWGCYQQVVSGADGTSVGTGYQNTMDIVNDGCSNPNGGVTAAQAALDAVINGYSDWYLPSRYELEEMYNTIGQGSPNGNIGGFSQNQTVGIPVVGKYWSSSESYSLYAWGKDFTFGFTDHYYRYSSFRVRPIRSF